MKKRELTKTVVVHLMIFSLVQSSMPYEVQAADIRENPIFQGAQGAMNIFAQLQMSKIQQAQYNAEMMRNANLRMQLQPKATPAQFFPECPMPPSMSSMPVNACIDVKPQGPQDAIAKMVTMRTYDDISQTWINYYDQMMNEAANGPAAVGVRCLDMKKKGVESQITEMINNLTRLQDRLNQDKQTFIANNKKLLDDFNLINDELNGTNTKRDLRKTTKDYSKLFSPSCQTAIGKEALSRTNFVGFAGVRDIMQAKVKDANDFNSNRERIRQDIERDIQRMQDGIRNNGLADWMQTVTPDFTQIASVKGAASKKVMEFQTAYNRISTELKNNYQYEAPKMDKNFSADFDGFVSSAKSYFKKRYVNECVTGADKGIAIPVDQILSSMTTTIKGSVGKGYLDTYRQEYSNIMNDSSLSVEDKDAKLKVLSNKFPNVFLRYRDDSANTISESPYQTFMKTAAKCESQYTESEEGNVNRGQALLRELQNLHANFASNLGQAVREKALNCDGEAKKDGAQCSGDTLNHKSEGFCIQHASECANEIVGCYDQADKYVKEAETKLTTLAATYNNNVANMVNRSRALFDQQKNAVMELSKMLQGKFPGTNFEIPKDMFISMPDEKLDATGVRLANDGNMSFMDELPKKIDLLKKVFEEQKEKTNEVLDDYIAKQKDAMMRERDRWQQLAGDCKRVAGNMEEFVAQANAAGQKDQAEKDQKVASFCAKYSDLRDNPMAGCDDAKKLAEDADKIASLINGGVRSLTREYRQACNSFNNEKDEDIGNCDDYKDDVKKKRACEEKERAYYRKLGMDAEQNKQPQIRLSQLCAEGKSDSDFIKSVLEKAKIEDDKLKSAASIDELIAADHPISEFFDNIKSQTRRAKKSDDNNPEGKPAEGSTCDKLLAIESAEGHLEADIKAKKEEAEKLEKDLAAEKAKTPADAAKVADLDKKVKKAKFEASASDLKASMRKTLASLKPEKSQDSLKEEAFARIGEQASEIPCTAQAGNTGMPKLFMGADDLMRFDQGVLGTRSR